MDRKDALEQGRNAFRAKAWRKAFTRLSAADRESSLEPNDLELLAKAAYLSGLVTECNEYWSRAHQDFLSRNESEKAIRCAFWLGLTLIFQGDRARGGGWMARAHRLLEEEKPDCVERGYLLLPAGLQSLGGGDAQKAYDLFEQAAHIGKRSHDPDLVTLTLLGRGQALIGLEKTDQGTTLLDEAMVAVESEEVSPIVAGIVYCAVIETCMENFDLRRAQEWTEALSHWCDSQPELVPFRGQCLIRRSEIMQLHGQWPDAMEEAHRACELLTKPKGEPAAGTAFYQQGELYRLRGEFSRAEEAYRQAGKWGRNPQPGFALLRMAEGQAENALTMIRRAADEAKNRTARCRILPAFVEIMIADENTREARTAAEELLETASNLDAPFLDALAAHAEGTLLLAEGNIQNAIQKLQTARSAWKQLQAPYAEARTRTLIGVACLESGDTDSAEIELEAAREIFDELGAAPDVTHIDSLLRNKSPENSRGLTPRELEILRLVATGKTNKSIASDLFISERTVDRHVSNIFLKLNVSTRTAATAYAYRHNLV